MSLGGSMPTDEQLKEMALAVKGYMEGNCPNEEQTMARNEKVAPYLEAALNGTDDEELRNNTVRIVSIIYGTALEKGSGICPETVGSLACECCVSSFNAMVENRAPRRIHFGCGGCECCC